MDLDGVPGRPAEIELIVVVFESQITISIETDQSGVDVRSAQGVIDYIVIRRVLVNAAAKRTVDIRLVPVGKDFCGRHGAKVDVILTHRAVIAVLSRRLLIQAVRSVIEEQELIAGHRHGVLPDRRQGASDQGERILLQGWELIPMFGWISQNPLDLLSSYGMVWPALALTT